jgi:hypothetical protein
MTLEQTLVKHGYCSGKDDIDDGRRSIYHVNGYLETRANAKEAWAWLRSMGLIKA